MIQSDKLVYGSLFKPKDAAHYLSVSESFLAKARMNGTGPAFIRLGRAIRYSQDALDAYKASQTRTSTSESAKGNYIFRRTPKQNLAY